jgi:MerR family transcriptional regulator, heat shock protein HspR
MPDDRRAGFAISVAADRADLPIQNLRVYERRGLLEPASELLGEGLNLAGIRRVLELEAEVLRLEAMVASRPSR